MTIYILGIPVKVKLKPMFDRDCTLYGSCDMLTGEINITSDCTVEQQNATYLHEVIHAINATVGANLTEEQVTTLAAGLFSVCKENGIDTKWIKTLN